MCQFNKSNDGRRIDPCMRKMISNLNQFGVKTLACCCGHGKYSMTIVADIGVSKTIPLEIFSNICLDHKKKKFYKKDNQGRYFIPETIGRIEE